MKIYPKTEDRKLMVSIIAISLVEMLFGFYKVGDAIVVYFEDSSELSLVSDVASGIIFIIVGSSLWRMRTWALNASVFIVLIASIWMPYIVTMNNTYKSYVDFELSMNPNYFLYSFPVAVMISAYLVYKRSEFVSKL